jgi:hypothetical protein
MFELCGKHQLTILNVDPQQQKLGQKDMRPAVRLRVRVTGDNTILNQFDTVLRDVMFEANTAAQTQGALEGIPVVSDRPQLTKFAKAIGESLNWEYKQGGTALRLYQGITGDMNIFPPKGDVEKFKFSLHEGGTVDVDFDYYCADIDVDTMGELSVLVKHTVPGELLAPEVPQQQGDIIAGEEDDAQLTPGERLQQAFVEGGTAAEGRAAKQQAAAKKASKRTPLAKKVARSSRKAKAH